MLFAILKLIRHLNLTTFCRGFLTLLTENGITSTLSRFVCFLNLTKKSNNSIELVCIIRIHLLNRSSESIGSKSTKRSIVNLTLSLIGERRIGYFTVNYIKQTFANLITIKRGIGKIVQRLCNCTLCTSNRCAAFRTKQTIYKYIRFFFARSPLESNFYAIIFIRSRSGNNMLVKRLRHIIFNKIIDTIFSTENLTIFFALKRNTTYLKSDTTIKIRDCFNIFTNTKIIKTNFSIREYLWIRNKSYFCTIGFTGCFFHISIKNTLFKTSFSHRTITIRSYLKINGGKTYTRTTNTIQTRSIFITVIAKFTAGMTLGINRNENILAIFTNTKWNATTIVTHTDGVFNFIYMYFNFLTITGKSFVRAVINNFLQSLICAFNIIRIKIHLDSLSHTLTEGKAFNRVNIVSHTKLLYYFTFLYYNTNF